MVKIQNKYTERIRKIQIVLFIIHIFLTVTPFIGAGAYNSEKFYTVIGLMNYIGSGGEAVALTHIGLVFSIFLIIPVVAVLFFVFDRNYNLKNVVGVLGSGGGIMLIIFCVGPNIALGSMAALFLYLVTFFLSVMGMMARIVKTDDKNS